MTGTSESIHIQASPQQVFDVIADFPRYPEFLPEIRGVTIESSGDNELEVTFSAQIIAPLQYTLHFTLTPPKGLQWTMIRGQILRKNDGGWKLRSTKDGGTEATYTIDVGFGPLVPSQISNSLAGSTLPATLQRFKARVESLQGTKHEARSTRHAHGRKKSK